MRRSEDRWFELYRKHEAARFQLIEASKTASCALAVVLLARLITASYRRFHAANCLQRSGRTGPPDVLHRQLQPSQIFKV